jgi:UDP:flavonoid glycosyltransferase YjiC (YdhE family)
LAKFLVTMLPANDLGLPTRMIPVARALAARGHDVSVFNPAPAPSKLIADAGLKSLPMPSRPMPTAAPDLLLLSQAWDVEHFFGGLYRSEEHVRQALAVKLDLVREFAPDAIVDSFDPLQCVAARILKVPLVTVLQGNFHPASRGFKWWEKDRPAGLLSGTKHVNDAIAEYGLAPFERCTDVMAGDLSLIVGTPETDPVDSSNVTYIGPMVFQRDDAVLPAWLNEIGRERPLVWVYSGNPRYAPVTTPIDSIVVIRSAIEGLADAPIEVVLTTGHQDLPQELGSLPENFHHAAYVPGPLLAERCDLVVFHGGHSSVMTTLKAGTPSVIIPTITERESNARRVVALGAGEMVMPVNGQDGEKHIDVAEFRSKVMRVLNEASYRQCAQRIADSMRHFRGTDYVAKLIESSFNLSRSNGG